MKKLSVVAASPVDLQVRQMKVRHRMALMFRQFVTEMGQAAKSSALNRSPRSGCFDQVAQTQRSINSNSPGQLISISDGMMTKSMRSPANNSRERASSCANFTVTWGASRARRWIRGGNNMKAA